jgi:hypothetical protein
MSTGTRMSFTFLSPGEGRGPGGAAAPIFSLGWTPAFAGERSKR